MGQKWRYLGVLRWGGMGRWVLGQLASTYARTSNSIALLPLCPIGRLPVGVKLARREAGGRHWRQVLEAGGIQ